MVCFYYRFHCHTGHIFQFWPVSIPIPDLWMTIKSTLTLCPVFGGNFKQINMVNSCKLCAAGIRGKDFTQERNLTQPAVQYSLGAAYSGPDKYGP
jgi:hypothetical protein